MATIKENQIIQSKIHIPSPEGVYLKRERLELKITDFIANRNKGVIFCTAPVGYGKSFLFSTVCSKDLSTAWFLAESSDNNPIRFLSCAVTALEQIGPVPLLTEATTRDNIDKLSGAQCANSFIKHFETYSAPVLWVIDEAQHLTHKYITDFLQELIIHLPQHIFLILISRTDLSFKVSDLRLQDLLLEIRMRDLRLNSTEITELFTLSHISFTPNEIATVYKKTEGWFACLKLFIVAWKQMPPTNRAKFLAKFGGTQRFIADYLYENFSEQLSPRTMHFLYTTSVTSCFTPELCSLLSGFRDCSDQLNLLKNSGLLYSIRYAQGRWYRYHHLLKDYLQMELPAHTRFGLHTKAADWFEAKGFSTRAQIHRAISEQIKKALSPDELAASENQDTEHAFAKKWELTRREHELLRFLESGLTNKEIGEKLFISEGTVKWHLNNIFMKIGAKTRTEAVKLVKNSGLI
jgi:LuxR family maltose regulon positive regulatory protein